jgi:hypothetical protein
VAGRIESVIYFLRDNTHMRTPVPNETSLFRAWSYHEHVPDNKSKKESDKATLASVKKEMAEPRIALSARMEDVASAGHDKGQKGVLSR